MTGIEGVLAEVAAYREATRHLRALLDEVDSGLGTFVALLQEDESVAGLLLGAGASKQREDFLRAMAEFDETRKRLRVAVLRLGLERGESLAAVARSLGISRQLASRLVAERPLS